MKKENILKYLGLFIYFIYVIIGYVDANYNFPTGNVGTFFYFNLGIILFVFFAGVKIYKIYIIAGLFQYLMWFVSSRILEKGDEVTTAHHFFLIILFLIFSILNKPSIKEK